MGLYEKAIKWHNIFVAILQNIEMAFMGLLTLTLNKSCGPLERILLSRLFEAQR